MVFRHPLFYLLISRKRTLAASVKIFSNFFISRFVHFGSKVVPGKKYRGIYMKKIGLIVFAVAILIGVGFASFFSWGKFSGKIFNVSVNIGAEKGSGTVAVESRELADFDSIEVGGVFQVEITAQKDFAVEIEADDNLLQYIKTEVSGGRLEISTDKRIKTSNPIRVRISAPNIERLDASGASRVSLTNINNAELTVDTSGASKINIAGETSNLIVDVSGASQIDAEGLKTVNANVEASGASHVNLNVSGELRSDASGASRITYSGTPNVSKKTSGASTVSQR